MIDEEYVKKLEEENKLLEVNKEDYKGQVERMGKSLIISLFYLKESLRFAEDATFYKDHIIRQLTSEEEEKSTKEMERKFYDMIHVMSNDYDYDWVKLLHGRSWKTLEEAIEITRQVATDTLEVDDCRIENPYHAPYSKKLKAKNKLCQTQNT